MRVWLSFWKQCAAKALHAGGRTYAAAGGVGALAFAVFDLVRYQSGQADTPGYWASGLVVAAFLGAAAWAFLYLLFVAPVKVYEETRTTLQKEPQGLREQVSTLQHQLEELRTQRRKRASLAAALNQLAISARALEHRTLNDGYEALFDIERAIREWEENAQKQLTALDASVWTRLDAAPSVTDRLAWMAEKWGSHMNGHVEAWQKMRGKLNKLVELLQETKEY